jgi:hypothetical protein
VIENSVLTLSVGTNSNIEEVYGILLKELKRSLGLFKNSIELFYVLNDGNIKDKSKYLIFIHGENEILNEVISPVIHQTLRDKYEKLNNYNLSVSLNYHFTPDLLFNNQSFFELTKPALIHFNYFLEWIEDFDENQILTNIFLLHLLLGSKLGFETNDYLNFNKYLQLKWGPYVYDFDKEQSFKEVDEVKKKKIREYENVFAFQREALIMNFSGILETWGQDSGDLEEEFFGIGIDLIKSCYKKLDESFFKQHFVPKFKLGQVEFEGSEIEKKKWIVLEEILSIVYSSMLLTSNQKYYIAFSCSSLLETRSEYLQAHEK